jgi:hypothetical protein
MTNYLANHADELRLVLIGAAIPYLVGALKFLFQLLIACVRRRRGPEAALLGNWFSFHYSRQNGKTIFVKDTLIISLDIRGKVEK